MENSGPRLQRVGVIRHHSEQPQLKPRMRIFRSLGFGILLITLAILMPAVFVALEETFIVALNTLQYVLSELSALAAVGQPSIPHITN